MTARAAPSAGTGRGKLLLCGEHAVVYGHPAIAIAVDRGTTVTLQPCDGPSVIDSPHADTRLAQALFTVLEPEGFRVTLSTDLPVGRGMGSSAALAVALVRARAAHRGETIDADEVYRRAMPIERAFHGNPSGVDVLVSAHGGCRWFRRGDPPAHRALTPGPWSLVVLDSGVAGDTKQLVASVAAQRPAIDHQLDRIGALVEEASGVLHDAARLGVLLTENHELLVSIGVSNDTLDRYVQLALSCGAYGAKLAGAGGGGVVIALVDGARQAHLLDAANAQGITAFGCSPWAGEQGQGL